MSQPMTKTEAFASFGTKMTNVRWSWSARTADGKTVVLALWSDRFSWKSVPITYNGSRIAAQEQWIERQGNKERSKHIEWAQKHCGGRFKVVMITPRDPNASPRQIKESFPRPEMTMEITSFDPKTSEFQAMLIAEPSAGPRSDKTAMA